MRWWHRLVARDPALALPLRCERRRRVGSRLPVLRRAVVPLVGGKQQQAHEHERRHYFPLEGKVMSDPRSHRRGRHTDFTGRACNREPLSS